LVIAQGDIWWADLGEPRGSEPGFTRPILVVQCDAFNQSRIDTVVCVALTSQIKWAQAPGNLLLSARTTGLDRDSVANVTQLMTVDRTDLVELAGRVSPARLSQVLDGIGVMLGR
jgi:mRNA interferase MazF